MQKSTLNLGQDSNRQRQRVYLGKYGIHKDTQTTKQVVWVKTTVDEITETQRRVVTLSSGWLLESKKPELHLEVGL